MIIPILDQISNTFLMAASALVLPVLSRILQELWTARHINHWCVKVVFAKLLCHKIMFWLPFRNWHLAGNLHKYVRQHPSKVAVAVAVPNGHWKWATSQSP